MRLLKTFLERSFTPEGIRIYTRNTAWSLMERALRVVLAITVGAFVARHLGPDQFGTLSYAISLLAIFTPVANLCIDNFVIRELVRTPERREAILGTSFTLRIVSGTAAFIGLMAAGWLLASTMRSRMLLLVVGSSMLWMPFQIVDDQLQSKLDMPASAGTRTVAYLVAGILSAAGVFAHLPLIYFGIIEGATWAFLAAGWLVMYRRDGSHIKTWTFDPKLARTFVKVSLPLMAMGILYILYLKTDHILIKLFLGMSSLGWYAITARMMETCLLIPQMVANAFFPAIIQAMMGNPEFYQKRLNQLYFLVIWSMAAVGIAIAAMSGPIVHLLYGASFAPSASLLRIYAWAAVPFAIQAVFVRWCIAEGELLLGVMVHASALAINLVINLAFMRHFGLWVPALAAVVSFPLGMLACMPFSGAGRKHLKIVLDSLMRLPA